MSKCDHTIVSPFTIYGCARHKFNGHLGTVYNNSPIATNLTLSFLDRAFVVSIFNPDSQYPERGYYFGGAGWNSNDFVMTFKLPNDLVGDKVLVQWRYITANSCNPPGYAEYFGRNGLSDIHWYPFIPTCPVPIPLDGDISKGPEVRSEK